RARDTRLDRGREMGDRAHGPEPPRPHAELSAQRPERGPYPVDHELVLVEVLRARKEATSAGIALERCRPCDGLGAHQPAALLEQPLGRRADEGHPVSADAE